MIHIYKLNGHRGVYDCANRTAYPLSALALKITDSISAPLTAECPSALRYAYAKYDSHDLSDAYKEIYALYEKGILFTDTLPEMKEPRTISAVITASAEAARAKIEAAAAAGFGHCIVTLEGGSPCVVASLREAYGDKVTLILSADASALAEADIAALNAAACYIHVDSLKAVLPAAERGIQYLSADIPATDAGRKEAAKLAKEIEKRRKDGAVLAFAPFDLALTAKEGYDAAAPACADCWAREICGGYALKAGQDCETVRTQIECAIALTVED